MKYFEQAVAEAKQELIAIRSNRNKISNTCTNVVLLDSTIRRWMKWYFKPYDSATNTGFHPDKCKSSKRDADDIERVKSSLDIDGALLLRYLKRHAGLSYDEQTIISRVFGKMKQWNGRVFCEVLYSIAGGKELWFKLFNPGKYNNRKSGKLSGFLVIVDEWQAKKCRQYAWSPKVLQGIAYMKQVQDDAAVVPAGC